MTARWQLAAGGEGTAISLDGEILRVVSPRAFAPGAPVEFTVEAMHLRAKSRGSRRRDDGSFDVRLRLVDLRRDDRGRLEQLLG